MKLWLISQDAERGYDTYDSAVVAAETEDQARMIHPDGHDESRWEDKRFLTWAAEPFLVKVEYLGEAKPGTEKGLILASFNAG